MITVAKCIANIFSGFAAHLIVTVLMIEVPVGVPVPLMKGSSAATRVQGVCTTGAVTTKDFGDKCTNHSTLSNRVTRMAVTLRDWLPTGLAVTVAEAYTAHLQALAYVVALSTM